MNTDKRGFFLNLSASPQEISILFGNYSGLAPVE